MLRSTSHSSLTTIFAEVVVSSREPKEVASSIEELWGS